MSTRLWLALVMAPLIAGAVYGIIGYMTVTPVVTGAEQPSFWNFAVLGAVLGFVCVLAVSMPTYLLLRRWGRLSFALFGAVVLIVWFAATSLLMAYIGQGWNTASATAVSFLPVAVAAAGTFWLIGFRHRGA